MLSASQTFRQNFIAASVASPNHKEGQAFHFDFTEIKEYFIEKGKEKIKINKSGALFHELESTNT